MKTVKKNDIGKKKLVAFVKSDISARHKSVQYNLLDGKKIGISISDSEDLQKLGFSKVHQQDTMIEFARYMLVHGATLVYGGDLRGDGYTLLFSELAYQYRSLNDQEKIHFINYSSYPIYNKLSPQQKLEFIKNRVEFKPVTPPKNLKVSENEFIPPIGNENKFIWAESLSKMRREMNKVSDARIFIGGKMSGYSGKYPGLIEEAVLSLESDIPTYLVGAFGGATRSVIDVLSKAKSIELTQDWQCKNENYKEFLAYYNSKKNKGKINYEELESFINSYTLKRLCKNNGLDEDDNKRLFKTIHIPEMIYLVLKGITNKLKQ
ncbi:MAG: hypothetical protein WAQ28_11270 [Bacteroidia bacterium]